MKSSPLFKLNFNDLLKGLLMAILTPAVYIIQSSLEAGTMTFNWHNIAMASVAGAVGYLVKNFFTPEPKKTEPKA